THAIEEKRTSVDLTISTSGGEGISGRRGRIRVSARRGGVYSPPMLSRRLPLLLVASSALLGLSLSPCAARAGGGPMNVIVLYSADDAKATEVAKLYEKERDLPPGHLCGVTGLLPTDTQI